MEFPGWDILAAWPRPGKHFPIGGITCLEIAGVFLHRPDSPGWSFVGGNFLLSFVLVKNSLGGLTWRESAGIFLPQQDLPGQSFASGNSLVSRCLVASSLGGVSWVGSAPAPSWNSLFGKKRDLLASLCLQRNFLGGVSWVGYPGWQFLAFLCLGEKLPRWTYLARKCWNLSSSARLSWAKFCEWKFFSFPLSGCKLISGVSWVEVPCSAPAPSWNSLFGI